MAKLLGANELTKENHDLVLYKTKQRGKSILETIIVVWHKINSAGWFK